MEVCTCVTVKVYSDICRWELFSITKGHYQCYVTNTFCLPYHGSSILPYFTSFSRNFNFLTAPTKKTREEAQTKKKILVRLIELSLLRWPYVS